MTKAILLPVLGSVVLLVLFFLLNIVKYIFLVIISLSSLLSLSWMLYGPVARGFYWIHDNWSSMPLFIRCGPDLRLVDEDGEEGNALLDSATPPENPKGSPPVADLYEYSSEVDLSQIGSLDSEAGQEEEEEEEENDDEDAESEDDMAPIGNEGVVGLCGPESAQRRIRWLCNEQIGLAYFPVALFGSFGLALTLLILWYTTNHWIVLNTLAICLAVTSLTSLRIQSIKVALVFLLLFFLYDIFWVFLSGYFFKESVMESVARNVSSSGSGGIDLPILIRAPKFGYGEMQGLSSYNWMFLSQPSAAVFGPAVGIFRGLNQLFRSQTLGFMMLGLGDIILPGVFINFLRRFDHEKRYMRWPLRYTTIGLFGCASCLCVPLPVSSPYFHRV